MWSRFKEREKREILRMKDDNGEERKYRMENISK